MQELPAAPKSLHPTPIRVPRPLTQHGLEPVHRHQRLWRERYDRDSDPRRFPRARKTTKRFVYHRDPTEFTWKSPIDPKHMAYLVRTHCTGRRREYLLQCYAHGYPDHFRGPSGVSNVPVNFVSPGDPGSELVDDFISQAVNSHSAVSTRLAIFPGTVTMAVGVTLKHRFGRSLMTTCEM